MLKRLLAAVLLAVFSLTALPLTALCADTFRAAVVLPYYQVWKTNVSDADDRFTYRWTVETEGAPAPKGVNKSYWDWNLRGNTEGKLSLVFEFEEPGAYSYRLKPYVPNPKKGYVYESRTYLLTVLVQNAPGGGLQADWFLLNEASGDKVERIDLDPEYKKEKHSSGDSDDDSKKKSKSSSGKKSSSSVRTGDESRARSWAAIMSASGLMLVFLVYEELKERKKRSRKRK